MPVPLMHMCLTVWPHFKGSLVLCRQLLANLPDALALSQLRAEAGLAWAEVTVVVRGGHFLKTV